MTQSIGRVDPQNPQVQAIADIIENHQLHGLLFQHIALCPRRAWLHIRRVQCAHLEERMSMGSVRHDLNRARDVSVEGLMGLAPDRIDWTKRVVIEAKGTAGAQEAVSYQTAFYAILLAVATQQDWGAQNDILSTKTIRPVPITSELLDNMHKHAQDLVVLKTQAYPPQEDRRHFCDMCGYRFLCWGG